MSLWLDLNIEEKIIHILRKAKKDEPEHHLGRPFLTAYQIAIKFAENYPDDVNRLNLPVGGAGTGQHRSLAQYIARELSQHIKTMELKNIEGSFLSNNSVKEIHFKFNDGLITSSLIGDNLVLSLFRLRDLNE